MPFFNEAWYCNLLDFSLSCLSFFVSCFFFRHSNLWLFPYISRIIKYHEGIQQLLTTFEPKWCKTTSLQSKGTKSGGPGSGVEVSETTKNCLELHQLVSRSWWTKFHCHLKKCSRHIRVHSGYVHVFSGLNCLVPRGDNSVWKLIRQTFPDSHILL